MVDLYIFTFYEQTKYWIVENDKTIFELEVNERQVSTTFYKVFDDSGVKFEEIKRFVFVNGPGSFTSLRFFLTFAKGLKVLAIGCSECASKVPAIDKASSEEKPLKDRVSVKERLP